MDKHLGKQTIQNSTLVELLRLRSLQQPEQRLYTFLIDGEVEGFHITYAQLDCQARAIGAVVQQHRTRGERALLLYPPGLEFIAAFCGCLYGGVIAIPAPPPDAARLKRTMGRLQAIAKDAQASLVLTTSRLLAMVKDFGSRSHFNQTLTRALSGTPLASLPPHKVVAFRKSAKATTCDGMQIRNCYRFSLNRKLTTPQNGGIIHQESKLTKLYGDFWK